MKKNVFLGVGALGLCLGLIGNAVIASANNIEKDTSHSQEVIKDPYLQTDLTGLNINESNTIDSEQATERGLGYYWKCYTCGYHSEWHMFAGTAVANANKHAHKYGHITTVYPN